LEIIRQGYGHAYTKYPFKQAYMERFRAAEKEAREAKRGLWGDAKLEGQKVEQPGKPAAQGEVFITKSGKKYHAAGCRSLSKSMVPITLQEAKKQGYTPCMICKPPR
jgi:Staphylococcal nuclease homologue